VTVQRRSSEPGERRGWRCPVLALLACLCLAPACSTSNLLEEPNAELASRIDEILSRPELRGSTLGIEFRRLRDGALLYQHGADRLLPPASTTKIIPSAAALAILGEDFRFVTRVVGAGELKDGALQGDLVLVASGDPNLSQRVGTDETIRFTNSDHSYAGFLQNASLVPGNPLQVLSMLAAQVKASGVKRVEGAVVVDDGLFQEGGEGLPENLSAICVNDNLVDVMVTPAPHAGEPPQIQVLPHHPEIRVENKARTVPPNMAEVDLLELRYKGGIGDFELVGPVPTGSEPILRVARLPDPALAAAHFLAHELAQMGITARDPPRSARRGPAAYEGMKLLARHRSPPLSEEIKLILKVSHNLHAEMLPLIISAYGRAGDRRTGSRREGYHLIQQFLRDRGIDTSRVILQSGSGLGPADRLSARFLVKLLREIATWKQGPAFHEALPIGGVDGTISTRFREPELRGRVRAKTGTLVYPDFLNPGLIYLSKALAGYLEMDDAPAAGVKKQAPPGPGENDVVFAILIANTYCRSRREGADFLFQVQEDILKDVVEIYGNHPNP